MFTFFLILAIIAALILFPAILFQAGQGGGLATQFGGGSSTDAFVGGRQAGTILHQASWWAGGGFLAICFILQLIGGRGTAPRSLTEDEIRKQTQSQTAPPPIGQTGAPALPLPGSAAPSGTAKQPAGTTKQPDR